MKKTRRSDKEILELYAQCQREVGQTVGQQVFTKRTGVRASEIAYYWPNWSSFVVAAGGTPNTATPRHEDDEVFRDFARVCLELEKVPTQKELRIATRRLGTKTHTIERRFGSRAAFDERFRLWIRDQDYPELTSILGFPGWIRTSAIPSSRPTENGPVPAGSALLHPFLPAALHHLVQLARGERPPLVPSESSTSLLFERRVADAFTCLGFEVEQLGQGTGRQADCLAVAAREGYALVIDAKVRRAGYTLGTEDRKFLEYAFSHARDLERRGISRIYLVIVAHEFQEADLEEVDRLSFGGTSSGDRNAYGWRIDANGGGQHS